MAFDAHRNFAYSTVATAPTPTTTGTTLVLAAGEGARFAAPCNVVVWPTGVQPLASNAEILRVTAVGGDTLTIVRGPQAGDAGGINRQIVAGDQVAEATTAKTFTDIEAATSAVPASTLTDSRGTTEGDLLVYDVDETKFVRVGVGTNTQVLTADSTIDGGVKWATPAAGGAAAPASTIPRWRSLPAPGVGGRVTGVAVSPFDPNRILLAGDMLGCALSEDGGQSWLPTTGFLSWEMAASFCWHPTIPKTVWVGSLSGPFKSVDGGRTWVSKRTGFPAETGFPRSNPVETILIDPANPLHMLAFGGNARHTSGSFTNYGNVYESTDGGENWTTKSTIFAGVTVDHATMGADFTALFASVPGHGVYKSINVGSTWTLLTGLPNQYPRMVTTVDGVTLYAAMDSGDAVAGVYQPGGIWKSTNGGTSWTAANTGLPQDANVAPARTTMMFCVHRTVDGTLFTADQNWNKNNQIFKSVDNAATWTSVTPLNAQYYPGGIGPTAFASDPHNPKVVWGVNNGVARTVDAGVTWTDPMNTVIGGKATGRGFCGLIGNRVVFSPYRKGLMLVSGTDAGHLLRSDDGGQTWTLPTQGWDNYSGSYASAFGGPTGDIAYVLLGQLNMFNGIGVSTDAGKTFTIQVGGALPARYAGGSYHYCGIAVGNRAGSVAYAALPDGNVYKTTDTGVTWVLHFTTNPAHDVVVSKDFSTVYIATNAGTYSGDGTTYSLMAGSPVAPLRLKLDSNGVLYSVSRERSGCGVWKYSAGAWSQLDGNWYIHDVTIDPNDPTHIIHTTDQDPFAATSAATGVWESKDSGVTFTQQNSQLPMLRGGCIAFDPWTPGAVVVGLDGGGFWRTTMYGANTPSLLSPAVAGIEDVPALQSSLRLLQDEINAIPAPAAPPPPASNLATITLVSRNPYQRTHRKLVMGAPVSQVGWPATTIRFDGTTIPVPTLARAADGSWIGTFLPAPAAGGIVLPAGTPPAQVRFRGLGYPNISSYQSTATVFSALGAFGTTPARVTVEFGHYGQYFIGSFFVNQTYSSYRLKVDGVYEQLTSVPFGNTGMMFVQRNFGSAAARHIEIEYRGAAFTGLQCGPNDSFWLPDWRKTPQVLWIGDSYQTGTQSSDPGFNDMIDTSMGLLGFDDVANEALGSTGYYHAGVFTNYLSRVNAEITAAKALPELVIVCGSINDDTEVASNVGGNATAVYAYIASVVPNTKVAVVQFSGRRPTPPGDNAVYQRTAVAAAAAAAPNVVGVLDLSTMITGDGLVGTPTGLGTGDVFRYSDGAHPTQAGHDAYGARIAQFLASVL